MTLAQSLIIIAGSLVVLAVFGVLFDRYLRKQNEAKKKEMEETVKSLQPEVKERKRDPKTGRFIKG